MVTSEVDATERDRKRPRIDEPATSHTPPNFTNHPTLYFGDGNVVLRCQQIYFRVHRTLLTRNSPVFHDILAERDRVGGDQFRGCTLLILDDDADDMEQLLNSVYDGFDIDISELTTKNFAVLASILRLITKYQVERPQKAIFDLLRREWPSTLERYDSKAAVERTVEGTAPEEYTVIHPATVIALLRECGYLSADLLAPLFYDLSKHVWQFTKPSSPYHLDCLSHSDIQRFVVGLNKLRALHVREARCPLGVIPINHHACHSALAVGWCGEAYSILHYQGNDMCRPLESWMVVISRAKLPSQPQAPVICGAPNENPGPAAPPPYNPPYGGGGDYQYRRAQGNPAIAGALRRAPAGPVYDHNIAPIYGYAQLHNGVAHGHAVAQQPAPPLLPWPCHNILNIQVPCV